MASEKLLIDATSLVEDLELLAKHEDSLRQSVILGVVHTINARSTIDAVEVVRCKDCKHWNIRKGNDPTQLYFCNFNNLWSKPCRAPYDFCSYGERKEEVSE